MKNRFANPVVRNFFAPCVVLLAVAGTANAQASAAQAGAGRLEGTWEVVLTGRNCATGVPVVTVRELATFDQAGTVIASSSGLPQALRTPGHGVWHHTTDRTYQFGYKFFTFDGAGTTTGWWIVRQELLLDESGNSYESAGVAEIFDANGALVTRRCSTTAATRFE